MAKRMVRRVPTVFNRSISGRCQYDCVVLNWALGYVLIKHGKASSCRLRTQRSSVTVQEGKRFCRLSEIHATPSSNEKRYRWTNLLGRLELASTLNAKCPSKPPGVWWGNRDEEFWQVRRRKKSCKYEWGLGMRLAARNTMNLHYGSSGFELQRNFCTWRLHRQSTGHTNVFIHGSLPCLNELQFY
jgi:hypothetical protein